MMMMMIKMMIMMFMIKTINSICHKRAPMPTAGLISLGGTSESQRLRSYNAHPLLVREPLDKCKTSSDSFCVKGPIRLNSLPLELQIIKDKHIFKARLKKHLIESYSDIMVCTNPRCTDRRHHH